MAYRYYKLMDGSFTKVMGICRSKQVHVELYSYVDKNWVEYPELFGVVTGHYNNYEEISEEEAFEIIQSLE